LFYLDDSAKHCHEQTPAYKLGYLPHLQLQGLFFILLDISRYP